MSDDEGGTPDRSGGSGRSGGVGSGWTGRRYGQARPQKPSPASGAASGGGRRSTKKRPSGPMGGSRQPARQGSAKGASGRGGRAPRATPQRRGRGGEEPTGPDVPQAPAGQAFARGLGAVGGSPVLLVTALFSVVALWLAFTTYGGGTGISPRAMVWFLALPPIHSSLDLERLFSGGSGAAYVVLFAVGLLLFRSLLTGFLVSEIARIFRSGGGEGVRGAGGSLRASTGALWIVMTIELGYAIVSLVVAVVSQVFLGAQLGLLALFSWVFGGVFFLAATEVVAVTEHLMPRQAVRLAYRATRLPGREHALLAVGYLFFTIFVSFVDPGGSVFHATPSLGVWSYVLFVSVLQVAALGAFTYRWLVQAEAVKEWVRSAPKPPRRRSRLSLLTGR